MVSRSTPRVRFGDITVREYPIIVGDNPGGIGGPPVTIGWSPVSILSVGIDEYEASRPQRRNHLEMAMPIKHRERLLRTLGFSRKEIMEGTKAANIARGRRARTKETLNLAGMSSLLESVSRKTKHVVTLGSSKRKERQFISSSMVLQKAQNTSRLALQNANSSLSLRRASSGSTALSESTFSSKAGVEKNAFRASDTTTTDTIVDFDRDSSSYDDTMGDDPVDEEESYEKGYDTEHSLEA